MNDTQQRFLRFLQLREEMRIHKETIGGPGPHSDDPILATHRFCNINREHDTVTKYIHEHFRVPFHSRGRTFMVRQMLFCRIFNEPPTLAVVCPLESTKEAEEKLKAYRAAGNKLMRGAYMMPPHGKHSAGQDLIDHQLENIDKATTGKGMDYTYKNSLREVAEMLMSVCGIGPFVANQVCTDLRYIPVWGRSYTDWGTFILCGPGTRRGMNRYFERKLDFPGNDKKFTEELLGIREEVLPHVSQDIKDYYRDPNNLSNSFCEFDKWERGHAQLKEGKEVTLRHYSVTENPATVIDPLNLLS